MSKKYFSHISSDNWRAQNKLHEAVKQIAHEMNHIIIDNDYPETSMQQFHETIASRINDANNQYSRCKPVKLSIWNIKFGPHSNHKDEEDSIHVNVSGIFQMLIIPVKSWASLPKNL